MTSLFENLKMKGGGNRKPGCPNDVHFKLHKISKGRSQKHSFFGLNLLTLPSCNCSFNLWCEYPALTKVSDYGISIVDKPDIKNYIANIISFVKSFNTDSIVIRLQAPKIQLDWTIADRAQMYGALTGTGPYGSTLSGASKERTFPFYSLEDSSDSSTIGYLITKLKKINSNMKIYLLPFVGFDAGYGGPFNFVTALSPSTPIPGYSASSSDNQNAVDSFWCAVHFYNWYNTYSQLPAKIGHGFDGVIIETEDSQLSIASSIPILSARAAAMDPPTTPNKQTARTYTLFNTSPQSSLVSLGIYNYASSPIGNTTLEFGLTGSPSLSNNINQINEVSIGSNPIKITTLWPQYYGLGVSDAPGTPEQIAYASLNQNKVTKYINNTLSWSSSFNNTTTEVNGMLSIETNCIRDASGSIVSFKSRPPFFGQAGWKWDNVCYVANNAIKSRVLSNGNTIKPAIFSGADLYTDLGNFTAETISNITINNNFNTSSC